MRSVATAAILGLVTLLVPVDAAPVKPAGDFAVPVRFWTEHDFHPLGYLERLAVADTARHLSDGQRAALANLFRAAEYACRYKYRQTYLLDTTVPSYRLLKRQYPTLESIEREGHNRVFLSGIVAHLEGPVALEEAERSRRESQRSK